MSVNKGIWLDVEQKSPLQGILWMAHLFLDLNGNSGRTKAPSKAYERVDRGNGMGKNM